LKFSDGTESTTTFDQIIGTFNARANFKLLIEHYKPPVDSSFDINGDGIVDAEDAKALLKLFDKKNGLGDEPPIYLVAGWDL